MKLANIILIILLSTTFTFAQYQFKTVKDAGCTAVKNQSRTGTCWSFATCSFLESELMRTGKGDYDLSEMFVVRNIYKDKAYNYVMRQGKANFSQGSLSHDFINTVARYGIIPEGVYSGLIDGRTQHDHGEMEAVLKGALDGLIKRRNLSNTWEKAFDGILSAYIGAYPETFEYKGKSYTPQSFAMSLGLDLKNYVSITSYTHHPYYEKFILEIPDNFSNGSFYNTPIQELEAVVDNAIYQGYTVAWDGDVSEKGFSQKEGLAIVPIDAGRKDLYKNPGPEVNVTQDMRQNTFESYATTDDHLMHIVGIVKDQNGEKYYKVKNSWGESGKLDGFLYMSAAYFRLKTVFITVNKNSVPKDIAEKMSL